MFQCAEIETSFWLMTSRPALQIPVPGVKRVMPRCMSGERCPISALSVICGRRLAIATPMAALAAWRLASAARTSGPFARPVATAPFTGSVVRQRHAVEGKFAGGAVAWERCPASTDNSCRISASCLSSGGKVALVCANNASSASKAVFATAPRSSCLCKRSRCLVSAR